MKTDIILVSNDGNQMEAALNQTGKVAAYKKLSPRSELQLRLLAEEMMGMMRSITGKADGRFWIEDSDNVYQLHLQVETRLDPEKRGQLLSASSSGKNEMARGLMGRLRDFFERNAEAGVVAPSPLLLSNAQEMSSTPTLDWDWCMTEYQNEINSRVEQKDEDAIRMWDELEKSVVTHVADEIKVSIRDELTEMVILKKLL